MNREEAIKLIDTHTVCFYNEIDSPTLQALHMAIEALSAEAEPTVIRCKDCKHRYMDGDVTHYCWCIKHDRFVDDTDYCSWAEESEVEE